MRRLLLISSSSVHGSGYLQHCEDAIRHHLADPEVCCFIKRLPAHFLPGPWRQAVSDIRIQVFRLHALERLRVADASVMPVITNGNINAPSMMIGERAADLLINPAIEINRSRHKLS